jgi:CelD/BcsL family acetyltransferase involved in cellulose biosynthesis
MVLEIKEIRSRDEFDLAEKDWNEVLRTSGEDDVFLRMEWLVAWWDAFGKNKKMLVLEVLDEGRVVGFAPFMISRRRLPPVKKIEFIATGPSDRGAILAEHGRKDVHLAIWKHVMKRKGWDAIELREMNLDGPTASNLRHFFPSAEYGTSISPCVTISGTYEDYLDRLEKKNRHGLRRSWRRLSEKHDVTFGWKRGADLKDEYYQDFIRLGKARWEGSGTESVLKYPDMVSFLGRAIASLSEEGITTFHYLEEGRRTIAIGLGFLYRQRYLCYLSGFDSEFATYSPGSLLVAKVIEMCHHMGLKEVDLLRGSEAYKYRFGAFDRRLVHFYRTREGPVKGLISRITYRPPK